MHTYTFTYTLTFHSLLQGSPVCLSPPTPLPCVAASSDCRSLPRWLLSVSTQLTFLLALLPTAGTLIKATMGDCVASWEWGRQEDRVKR